MSQELGDQGVRVLTDEVNSLANTQGLIMYVQIPHLNQTLNQIWTRPRTVLCASCGNAFQPNKNRLKFCDHACYANWRSERTSFVERFWSKVNKTADCWLWTGATRGGGYGFIAQRRVDGKQVRTMAHRMSWELAFGPIQDGLVVCHRCDTPACVNPGHLFLGTQQDNIVDALHKGRLIGRDGRHLHATAQSLQPKRQQEPRSLRGSGVTDQSLADVHRFHVGSVADRHPQLPVR